MTYSKFRYFILCLSFLLLSRSESYADDMPAVYDAAVAGGDFADAPDGPVTVAVNTTQALVSISPDFYGVNIHPAPVSWAFRNKKLVADLKPDVIRIMGLRRRYWLRDANDNPMTLDSELSPVKGVYDFTELDAMISAIESIGAKTYLTLGFGAPPWLADPSGSSRLPRVIPERIGEYAKFMARIVQHVNGDGKSRVKWVTIDNEPENLQYTIGDYIKLVQLASKAIKDADPAVKICGPVTGYAMWKQPDGRKLSFASSLKIMKDAGLSFDMIDWHIYSTNPDLVIRCADTVSSICPGKPIVISEINRDWRYSGKGGEISKDRNTDWDSVVWLAYCYDYLQRRGVEQVHYFCMGNNYFGLFDYHQTKVNPNYHFFAMMTNLMGRERVEATSSNSAIGVIATVDGNNKSVLLYNRSNLPVTVLYNTGTSETVQLWDYNKSWYKRNHLICDGEVGRLTPKLVTGKNTDWIVPARGLLLLKY